jgi:carbonic anhydrase
VQQYQANERQRMNVPARCHLLHAFFLQLSIVTCMDSRLLIDKMLPGVDIGDVEIIRNAGEATSPLFPFDDTIISGMQAIVCCW